MEGLSLTWIIIASLFLVCLAGIVFMTMQHHITKDAEGDALPSSMARSNQQEADTTPYTSISRKYGTKTTHPRAYGEFTHPSALIIEDSRSTNNMMAETLITSGYRVSVAYNGEDGLALALRELPDCIILDVIMPGLNGWEVCRKLREHFSVQDLPVLMVSQKISHMDRAYGIQQGANAYLCKPFEPKRLVSEVTHLIERRTVAHTGMEAGFRQENY